MNRKQSNPRRSKVNMTPMIDVVFLLLSFFIMTFRIIAPEGDFNIRMPPKGTQSDTLPSEPIRVKLYATPGGGLSSISYGENSLGRDFMALRRTVLQHVSRSGGPGKADVEVELDPDQRLRWEYVIEALTAVTGELGKDRRIYKICDRVKFAPRHK